MQQTPMSKPRTGSVSPPSVDVSNGTALCHGTDRGTLVHRPLLAHHDSQLPLSRPGLGDVVAQETLRDLEDTQYLLQETTMSSVLCLGLSPAPPVQGRAGQVTA